MLLKSTILTVLLLAATGAKAVHVNTDGAGQIALLPYYNVNNNFITNLTITNTTNLYKAVKVRFYESRIGADVFDFNVYLTPYDIWNASLRLNRSSGLPNLITEDESCTYPDKSELQSGIDFNNNYSATSTEDLTEGYVEIIEMGVIADGRYGSAVDGDFFAEIDADGSADGVISSGDRSIVDGLRHDTSGVPFDCSVVVDAWNAGNADEQINGFESGELSTTGVAQDPGGVNAPYADTINAGLVEPTGGIKVYSIMINVASGAAFVQQATHIENYTTVAQHYRPDDPVNSQLPSLASGDVQRANMLSSDGNSVKSIVVPLTEYDTGSLFDISPNPSIPMGSNPLPIALVLSADSVASPYFTESGINGETDIVLTFPMQKYGIWNGGLLMNDLDANENMEACEGDLYDDINDGRTVTLETLNAQVNDYPHDSTDTYCTNAGYYHIGRDIEIALFYYDYEEKDSVYDLEPPDFGVAPIGPWFYEDVLQRTVNVVSVQRATGGNQSILGTPTANVYNWQLDSDFEAGWVNITFDGGYDYEATIITETIRGIGTAADVWTGVPVIGFATMAAEVGPAQLGEVIELYRSVNRTLE
ncbi:MAG: hypothetical protein ABW124_21015 [Candidatus Thiodiazotropha sp. 6PLUC9]